MLSRVWGSGVNRMVGMALWGGLEHECDLEYRDWLGLSIMAVSDYNA